MRSLFGTVSGKKITFWAFKKHNDTRESAAIYIADILIENGAILVYMIRRLLNSRCFLT